MGLRKPISKRPGTLALLLPELNADTRDPGFSILMTLCRQLGIQDHRAFFLLIALAQMLCVGGVFRRYSTDFWLSLFLFVASTDYISWMFNGTRQFLAVTMTFAAFPLLVRGWYAGFILVVLLASQFHASAVLMLPAAWVMRGRALNGRTLAVLLGTVLVLPFVDRLLPLMERLLADTPYSTIIEDEIWQSDDGTHPIRVLVYAAPMLMALLGLRRVRRADSTAMNLCVNATVITTALYLMSMVTSGIYVGRLPIYTTLYGYLALPWMIDEIFERSSATLVKTAMMGCYLLFFAYQMRAVWGLL